MKNTEAKSPRHTRWALRGGLAGLILLALAYMRCGGLGLGGGGGGTIGVTREPPRPVVKDVERPTPAAPDAGVLRCQLRLDGSGLWQLGATGQAQVEVEAAVASCKEAGGADVVITGDARQGAWDELRAALDGAGVPAFVRGGGARTGGGATPGSGAATQ